ncbi:MAG TPA: hypothetical protein VF519_00065 [Mycobacteriales bacterium]|jgi:type III secretory pathway component EscR
MYRDPDREARRKSLHGNLKLILGFVVVGTIISLVLMALGI